MVGSRNKENGSYVKKIHFRPKKRLCSKSEHLFIVIMYKTRICHSLEILFEPPHLLLGERTMEEVNFQYKNRGGKRGVGVFLKCFSSSKCFRFQKGHF